MGKFAIERLNFELRNDVEVKEQVKGKAIPVQGWTGPGSARRLRLPDFKTVGTLRW
jgi:hypothetical protein